MSSFGEERATFSPYAEEIDPLDFVDRILSDPRTAVKMPELATDFHPDNHPQVAATLRWASEQGQAILLGDVDGDFDVMTGQVHLNLDIPMLGAKFSPYGYLHLMLHDLTHHFLGQLRVTPADIAPDRIRETRKQIHQAAMLGELVASYATVSRIIPGHANYQAAHGGPGRTDQFGGFFSFAKSEREVIDGWKALYTGGAEFTDYLRRELDSDVVLDFRRAGNWLVWPGLARLLGLQERGPAWLVDLLHRIEARFAPSVLPRIFPWAYWNRSVYSVASFQEDCRHLADRYTSPWHVAWQADFNEGASFETLLRRCNTAFRGLVFRDYSFFDAVPNDIGPGGFPVTVRRRQIRMFTRKLYELRHHIDAGTGLYTGADRVGWLSALDTACAEARDLFWTMPSEADSATSWYRERFLPLRAELIDRWAEDRSSFALAEDRADFLSNPNRLLFDPGVRDANAKPRRRKTLRERWESFKGMLRAAIGHPVSMEEREWIQEIYANLDHQAVFDEAEAWGIPTIVRGAGPALRLHSSAPPRERDDERKAA